MKEKYSQFDLSHVDNSWLPLINKALEKLSPHYKEELYQDPNWLPGPKQIFNAFSLPLPQVKYILFGESPYPRAQSAIGYAFWDGAVKELWSKDGLSKTVNRATSLRNFIKMLLVASKRLPSDNTSQSAIVEVDKTNCVLTADELFNNLQAHGILLLNATLVLTQRKPTFDAKAWLPFMDQLLSATHAAKEDIQLILLGNIAKKLSSIESINKFDAFYAEHPYNISFINNPKVIEFFAPFRLLEKTPHHSNSDSFYLTTEVSLK